MQIFFIQWGHEGSIGAIGKLVGKVIGFMLNLFDAPGVICAVFKVLTQCVEFLGCPKGSIRLGLQQLEERAVFAQ
jgi:hypothetical protein